MPQIRIHDDLGIANIGATLSVPRARTDINYQVIDNFSWKLTRHDLKFGYEFRRTTVDQFFDAGYRGRLDFGSLADFLSGTLSGGRAARGNSSRFTFQNSHAGYVQDTFRQSPQLTLNLGLRWDFFGVIDEKNHLLSNLDPTRGLVQVGSAGLPRLYDRDWNNFSPRLGLAWNVNGKGKTVLRAGWGLFYDAFSQDFFAGQLPFNTFNPGPASIQSALLRSSFRFPPLIRFRMASLSSPTSSIPTCSRSIQSAYSICAELQSQYSTGIV